MPFTTIKYLRLSTFLLLGPMMLAGCEKKQLPLPDNTITTNIADLYKKLPDATLLNLVGDTLRAFSETPLPTTLTTTVDVSALKNTSSATLKGKPLRLVSIGGSITAGVRDGGYFNDGMLTAYPNLIARQIQLNEFRQALFPAAQYNGFGLRLPTGVNPTGGPVVKFLAVKNNLGIPSQTSSLLSLTEYQEEIDNWAVPYITRNGLINKERNEVKARFWPFEQRLTSLKQLNEFTRYHEYNHLLKAQKNDIDFYLLEIGFDDLLTYALSGGNSPVFDNWFGDTSNRPFEDPTYDSAPLQITRLMSQKGAKGCIATIPDILELPYFKQANRAVWMARLGNTQLLSWKTPYKDMLWNTNMIYDLLLPTSAVDSLLSNKISNAVKSGLSGVSPLLSNEVLLEKEKLNIIGMTHDYNNEYLALAKKFNLAVVDLNALYKQILSGNYIEDGIKINPAPTYLNGNFFSSDGLTPTPLGQAIIANEFIRTINTFYKTRIPAIALGPYAR